MSERKKKTTKKTTATSKKKAAAKPKPATSRPDEMTPDVLEFITAIDDYKRLNGRPFPSWTEVLEIVKGLGYDKAS